MTIPTIHTLEPAYSVVEKLGGKGHVANQLGLATSTLSRWCSPFPQGTGGVIPQKHWPQLMQMARLQRVRLTLRELAALEA